MPSQWRGRFLEFSFRYFKGGIHIKLLDRTLSMNSLFRSLSLVTRCLLCWGKNRSYSFTTITTLWCSSIQYIQVTSHEVLQLKLWQKEALRELLIVFLGAEHTAPGRAFITMNYFAHSVMYTYYTIVAYGIRLPRWVSSRDFARNFS